MKTRGVLIAGNWKMNLGPGETEKFFWDLAARAQKLSQPKVRAALFPPMLSLLAAREFSKTAPFAVTIGAQNVHWELKGAFTGEISGPMLKEIDIALALVGHSERRQYFGETDQTVLKRSDSLIHQGFEVIVCIGETLAEREAGRTFEVLTRQIDHGISPAAVSSGKLIIAYEPVWAIGTGLTATPAQAQEAHSFIRAHLGQRFGKSAEALQILYGGSVTPENVDSLLACKDVDGGLVGGASVKPESFLALIEAGERSLGNTAS
jgi:triosephosphate isomerase